MLQMSKLFTLAILAIATLVSGNALAQMAQVQVIHNSPDPAAASVDVYVNDDLALDDFGFREATPVIELPAMVELVLGIAPGNSAGPEDIIATFPVTLETDMGYVVMATGVLDGSLPGNPEGVDTAFTLEIFTPLTTDAPGGEVNLLAYHGAPDAPTVDVRAVGVGVLFGELQYGNFDGYLAVPAGNYTLEITPAGDADTVVASFEAPLSGLDGGAAVVFASGFLTERLAAFGLFAALADGTVLELSSSVANEAGSWSDMKSMYR